MSEEINAGLLVLHGNRLELLGEAVLGWLARHPLAPLEQEVFLVQSNGMGEWLKMALASAQGVCAATSVELPARFLWRAWRAVLGRAAVPAQSALDKLPMTWRLMRLLPELAAEPGFAPVARFLEGGDAARRLQLAQRLADLFDQYQVYRSDWLEDWARGDDLIRTGLQRGGAHANAVPPDQVWQPALWRALLRSVPESERAAVRGSLHRRFMDALQASAARGEPGRRAFPGLPRRVVLFGTSHIPHQTLEAIAALSLHCQVLMAVPNPSRYHWADIIDGRELLRTERRRQALRQDRDLSGVPLEDMHAHGHPLLAAWGRQSRDFVRQLDAFDDVQAAQQRFQLAKADLFDETPGTTLLEQVQVAVRDLMPLAEHAWPGVADADRSIVFHVAHSAQREVEVLHDQLLKLLADPPGGRPLNPRDIAVLVPDIDTFAPVIRSVFGQHARHDPRYIPWGIADQKARGHQPLMTALEWLLHAPQHRFGASEVRDLLDVPSVALRFGVSADDLPTLVDWIAGAGVRWGLAADQRDSLGLGAAGDQNTWAFGLRRILLGYAAGELSGADGFAGIEPYAEVAGLDAGLAGALAELVGALSAWWRDGRSPRSPAAWAERLRELLAALFDASDDDDRIVLDALADALSAWLQACESAGFDDPVELAVVREAWLGAVDQPEASARFRAGGVTFCTLLPMRAIPFPVLCLLGMNDGDYPRRASRSDFDLMALPGQARPGDRSRRDDDRQLMLDAVLSARRVLYVSWAGRSQRDNQAQPPSILVSQLRDYLAAGWGEDAVAERTLVHPLQPFSRRYFEATVADEPRRLFTYASEWRAAHAATADAATVHASTAAVTAPMAINVALLASFLRNPVKEFFRQRLQVSFGEDEASDQDDEDFGSAGLPRWQLMNDLLLACRAADALQGDGALEDRVAAFLRQEVGRLARAGRLPMAGPGRLVEVDLVASLSPLVTAWQRALADHPEPRGKLPLRVAPASAAELVFEDWLVGLRADGGDGAPLWIDVQAGRIADAPVGKSEPVVRKDKLLTAWLRCLASAASGCPTSGIVIGEGALARVSPPARDEALAVLSDLMSAVREGVTGDRPLPTALLTGLALLTRPADARARYDGGFGLRGEGQEPCLARLYPDFASLAADPDFEPASRRLYEPYQRWLDRHVTITPLADEPPNPGARHA